MLAQAAAAGAGVALIPKFLLAPEIGSGTLVVPIEMPLSAHEAYYLVSPRRSVSRASLDTFRAWITSEARKAAGGGGASETTFPLD